MKVSSSLLALLLIWQAAPIASFQSSWRSSRSRPGAPTSPLRPAARLPAASASVSAGSPPMAPAEDVTNSKQDKLARLREEGGRFTVMTPYGALNPFGLYYGVVSVLLGIPWFISMTLVQCIYVLTRGRFDRQRRIPIFLSQCWGEALMTLTRMWPRIKNREILTEFYRQKRPAMVVANHNSWLDIPFLGATIGWRNYKLVSKKELGKVPILGKSIRVGGHIMVDRSDRKSQLKTLKAGINYLKDGLILGTFPEGTRSRSGRLGKFKNGAFKMAYKAEAPVIPISINGAAKIMSSDWVMPHRRTGDLVEVVIHEPVESTGKTEEELAEAVRQSMISGLAPDQRPKE